MLIIPYPAVDLFSRRGVGNHLWSWEGNLGHYQEYRAALRCAGILPGQLFSLEGVVRASYCCLCNLLSKPGCTPEHFRDVFHKVRFQNQSVLVRTPGFEKVGLVFFLQETHVIYILVVRTAARKWESQVKLLSQHSWERATVKSFDQEDRWGLNKRLSYSRHPVPSR